MSNGNPFVRLNDVTLRVGDHLLFEHTDWEIKTNEHWVIIGPNGSGKSTLANAICRKVSVVRGQIHYFFPGDNPSHDDPRSYFKRGEIVRISAEAHNDLMRQQGGYHQARWQSFEGQDSPTVSELLTGKSIEHISAFDVSPLKVSEAVYKARREKAVAVLGLDYLLNRKLLHLSNGEARKVLLARALMQRPHLLIFDDPFAGLDYVSRDALQNVINTLLGATRPQVLLITSRLEEIPQRITHVLRVAEGRVVEKGPKHNLLQTETAQARAAAQASPEMPGSFPVALPESATDHPALVEMKDTTVAYGDTVVLHTINWTVKQGEHWAVLGPNGAGKTTLLSLILADNPQAYANEITLFGKRRGSGESVWDIKHNIGWVSPELQAFHQKRTPCLNVVCSGFFDSVGLYKTCSPEQIELAKHWLDSFSLSELADQPLGTVSVGQQRLVFLARALVKNPRLLIFDELGQGLDYANRKRILNLLDQLCRQTPVSLIYVTHHFDEMPQAITHVLKLDQGRIEAKGRRKDVLGW